MKTVQIQVSLSEEEAYWSGATLFAKTGHIRVQQDQDLKKKSCMSKYQYILMAVIARNIIFLFGLITIVQKKWTYGETLGTHSRDKGHVTTMYYTTGTTQTVFWRQNPK